MPADAGDKHQFTTFDPVLEGAVFSEVGPAYRIAGGGIATPDPDGAQPRELGYIDAL